mmetsp:Transcript_38210/g.92929  ORF Transcript_38210/g.92929 Transcript_38210/m.92929 type:complete len:238 (+) Transcript_38210:1325-2038(+)
MAAVVAMRDKPTPHATPTAALSQMVAAVVRPWTIFSLFLADVVMTPAPTKPTPEMTFAAIRDGSYRHPTSMNDANPYDEHTVNAAAPMLTSAMVRTPALCFANDRSFPNAAPNNAAYNNRSDNLISVMADTGHDAAAIAVLAAVTAPGAAVDAAIGANVAAATGILAVAPTAAVVAAAKDAVDAVDEAQAAFTTGPNDTNETMNVAINAFLAIFFISDDVDNFLGRDDVCKDDESPR